jgi:glycosyltransferase involved in cell wall biosynthesis
MVEHGRTGWHFRSGDASDLAACLERVWQNPQQLDRFRQAAYGEFLNKYTAQRNYELLMEIYHSVVGAAKESHVEHEPEPALTS